MKRGIEPRQRVLREWAVEYLVVYWKSQTCYERYLTFRQTHYWAKFLITREWSTTWISHCHSLTKWNELVTSDGFNWVSLGNFPCAKYGRRVCSLSAICTNTNHCSICNITIWGVIFMMKILLISTASEPISDANVETKTVVVHTLLYFYNIYSIPVEVILYKI